MNRKKRLVFVGASILILVGAFSLLVNNGNGGEEASDTLVIFNGDVVFFEERSAIIAYMFEIEGTNTVRVHMAVNYHSPSTHATGYGNIGSVQLSTVVGYTQRIKIGNTRYRFTQVNLSTGAIYFEK